MREKSFFRQKHFPHPGPLPGEREMNFGGLKRLCLFRVKPLETIKAGKRSFSFHAKDSTLWFKTCQVFKGLFKSIIDLFFPTLIREEPRRINDGE